MIYKLYDDVECFVCLKLKPLKEVEEIMIEVLDTQASANVCKKCLEELEKW